MNNPIQTATTQVTQKPSETMAVTDILATMPNEAAVIGLAGVVVAGLLALIGKLFTASYGYKASMAANTTKATTDALTIQNQLMERMQVELNRNSDQFKEALIASEKSLRHEMKEQKEAFKEVIDRLREKRDQQEQELKELNDRITRYEAQEESFKKIINEWQSRYMVLNREYDRVSAKLEQLQSKGH